MMAEIQALWEQFERVHNEIFRWSDDSVMISSTGRHRRRTPTLSVISSVIFLEWSCFGW